MFAAETIQHLLFVLPTFVLVNGLPTHLFTLNSEEVHIDAATYPGRGYLP
jgi:hypothetical protein